MANLFHLLYLLGGLFFLCPLLSFAQITILPGIPSKAEIARLFGPGVEVDTSSIRLVAAPVSSAYYQNGISLPGAQRGRGIILTTGNAQLAQGTNQGTTLSTQNQCFAQTDSDLEQIASGSPVGDVAFIECKVRFASPIFWVYPFYLASEEYPEAVLEEPTDIFGLFLSAPSATAPPLGYQNIAFFPPANNAPITYATINRLQNPAFYQDIPIGQGPLAYNGMTKALAIQRNVIPGLWYTLKIAVGDRKDCALDSGVLLEERCFHAPGVSFKAPAALCLGSKGSVYWELTQQDYRGKPIFSPNHTLILEISDPNGNFNQQTQQLAVWKSNEPSGSILFDLPPNLINSPNYKLRIRTFDPTPLISLPYIADTLFTSFTSPSKVSVISQLTAPSGITEYARCGPGVITFSVSGLFPAQTPIGVYNSASSFEPIQETTQAPYGLQVFVLQGKPYYIRARLGSCFSEPLEVRVKTIELPAPPEAVLMRCGPGNLTFTYTPQNPDIEGLALYTAITGGSPIATAEGAPLRLITPIISATRVYYLEAYNRIGCQSQRSPLVIGINPIVLPPPPLLILEKFCQGDSLQFRIPSGVTDGDLIRIYETAQGGLPLITLPIEAGAMRGPLLQSNKTYYFASVYSATGCESPRVSEIIRPLPQPPSPIVQGGAICAKGSTYLRFSSPFSYPLKIYDGPYSNAALLHRQETYIPFWQTPLLTTTTAFFIASYNPQTGCESVRARAEVLVHSPPSPPILLTSKVERCGAGAVRIPIQTDTPPPFELALYSSPLSNLPINIETQSAPPYAIAATAESPETVYVAIRELINGCLSQTRTPAVVDILPLPEPPAVEPIKACGPANISFTVFSPFPTVAVKLYETLLSPNPIAVDSFPDYRFNLPLNQSAVYYVSRLSSKLPGCESPRVAQFITLFPRPAQPLTSNFISCQGATITLTATAGSAGHFIRLFNSQSEIIAQSVGPQLSFELTPQAPQRLSAQSVDPLTGCESEATPIWVALAQNPPKPLVASDTIRCGLGSQHIPIRNATSGIRYNLYLVNDLSTSLASVEGGGNTTILTTPPLTRSAEFMIRAENTSSGCLSQPTLLKINVLPKDPSLRAEAGPDKTIICGSSTRIGHPIAIEGALYAWEPISGISNPFSSSPQVSPRQETTYTLTVTRNGCAARDEVTVRPIIAGLSLQAIPASICQGQSAVIIASGADSYLWNPSTTLSANSGATVEARPEITTTYTVIATQGACIAKAEITLRVNRVTFEALVQPTATQTGSIKINVIEGSPPFVYSIGGNIQSQAIFSGLAPGRYWVNVQDSLGCVQTAQVEVPRIPSRCGGPLNIRILNKSENQVTLSWETGLNALYYELSLRKEGTDVFGNPIRVNGTSFTFFNLESGASYQARVRSVCLAGYSESPYEIVNFSAQPCDPVRGLAVMASSANSLTLRWERNFDNTAFRVEYKSAQSPTWIGQNTTLNQITLTDLTPNTNYEIRVQSLCNGLSSNFQTISVTTASCSKVSFTRVTISAESININWDPIPEASAYEVEYRLASASFWQKQIVNFANYQIRNPVTEAAYELRVRSLCQGSFSEFSELAFTASGGPGACQEPRSLEVIAREANGLRLRWNPTPNALYYLLRYRAVGENEWKLQQANALPYALGNLNPATLYELQVAAACPNNFSGWSQPLLRSSTLAAKENLSESFSALSGDWLSLYPNPNRGNFTFKLSGLALAQSSVEKWQMLIYNPLGQIISEQTLWVDKEEIEINVSLPADSPAGRYMCKLIESGREWNASFIVLE
jgi:hypothetical protein